MPGYTDHYHLETLSGAAGDAFALDGYKYTIADRQTIDNLLYLGAEAHHHSGVGAGTDPTTAPSLVLESLGGNLPAGTTFYYEYTYTNSEGLESGPSPATSVTTESAVSTPSAPTGLSIIGTGTLPPGPYLYLLTAYVNVSTAETLPSSAVGITLVSTGENVIDFPTLPTGATGWNIYQLTPSGVQYLFLTSVNMNVATPPTSFIDNGSIAANCNRTPPISNTTNATSEVIVSIPSAPPSGDTWNLYRTSIAGSWGGSLIASGLVASGATPVLSFTDTGVVAGTQGPPVASQIPGNPTKVLLTDGAEVQGLLPANMVIAPICVEFDYPGTLVETTGVSVWVCPFSSATIMDVTCTLGRGSAPASQTVIADVLKGSGNNPTYSSIYSGATPAYPYIAVGAQVGVAAPPNITNLALGDTLSSAILQSGGGATPTDHDLTIVVRLFVSE